MTIGRPPQQGQGIGQPDFVWLNGLAGGNNFNCQTVAAPNAASQATATQIGVPNAQGIEAALIDCNSSVNTGSLQLPQAVKGKELSILNRTANTINVYASPQVNKVTGALDVIIGAGASNTNATAVTIATFVANYFFCPVDGVWAKQ